MERNEDNRMVVWVLDGGGAYLSSSTIELNGKDLLSEYEFSRSNLPAGRYQGRATLLRLVKGRVKELNAKSQVLTVRP